MRLLVCGGREYADRDFVFRVLDAVNRKRPISVLMHGACPTGADKFADDWLKARGIEPLRFPADWRKYGRAAGPIRNKQMRDEGRPDGAVAFPGNDGTAGMVAMLREIGIEPWFPAG